MLFSEKAHAAANCISESTHSGASAPPLETLGFSREATVGQPDEAAVTQTRSIGFLFRKLNWLVVILLGSHLFLQGLFERSSPLQEVQSL